MDAATLSRAMGASCSMARYEQLCPAFNAAMLQAGITTVNRAAMWCAQLGEESVGLDAMEEYASGAEYEGRTDLGNVYAGDGVRFKGRGPIQVTGRANYGALSKWAHTQGYVPTATYFVDHPTELSNDTYGFLGPVWYWTVARPTLNSASDAGDVVAATRLINGGTNGLSDRISRWNRCLAIGAALLPEGDLMATIDDNQKQVLLGAAYQTGDAQVSNGKAGDDAVYGPRELRHPDGYNVSGGNRLAKLGKKLGYLRAMVTDTWNEVVFDGYVALVEDKDHLADEGKYGSPVAFILAAHANARKAYLIAQRIAVKLDVDVTDIVGGGK